MPGQNGHMLRQKIDLAHTTVLYYLCSLGARILEQHMIKFGTAHLKSVRHGFVERLAEFDMRPGFLLGSIEFHTPFRHAYRCNLLLDGQLFKQSLLGRQQGFAEMISSMYISLQQRDRESILCQ